MAHILVVGENSSIRSLLLRALVDAEHEIIESDNAQEGFRLFRQRPADLVIADIHAPEEVFLAQIQEFKTGFPEVGIIALISPVLPFQIACKIEETLGNSPTLVRPFDIFQLFVLVEKALGKQ